MPSIASTYTITASESAAFAVSSRLISCLVTEGLLRAFYVPLPHNHPTSTEGAIIVLAPGRSSDQSARLHTDEIFAIVHVHHAPVLAKGPKHKHGFPVALVDPLDMLPEIYDVIDSIDHVEPPEQSFQRFILGLLARSPAMSTKTLVRFKDPGELWKKFTADIIMQETLRTTIEKELMSSFHWQALTYEKPPSVPSPFDPPIVWEQSLVSGHPTHPMNRARMLTFKGPPNYDWYNPLIRFAWVPRSALALLGTFEDEITALARRATARAGKQLPLREDKIIMPVHEMQVPTIIKLYPEVEIMDPEIHVPAQGQSSLRTVVLQDMPGRALKLAVNVKITSSLRTISHYTANFGPRFSQDIIPKLAIDRKILEIETEPGSAVAAGVDAEVAKHFTAVIREQFEPKDGENVIVCASLLEWGHAGSPSGVSAVQQAFSLDTDAKRIKFLDRYIRLACEAMIPPLIHNGVSFEAHAQNLLARFDVKTGTLLGFVIRDLGGLRIHPETLCQSTGVDFEFLPGHCVVVKSLEDTWPKLYHTLVHNHLQRLIRLLGLHYNGVGYELLRRHLDAVIPVGHGLRRVWLGPEGETVQGKCLMRMRMQGVYRDMVFNPFPNMIRYRGTTESDVDTRVEV